MTLTDDEVALVIRALDFAIAYEEVSETHQVFPAMKQDCRRNIDAFTTLETKLRTARYEKRGLPPCDD